MTTMRVQCPNPKCRTILSVSIRYCGWRVRCSCCRKVFRMPRVRRTQKRTTTAAG